MVIIRDMEMDFYFTRFFFFIFILLNEMHNSRPSQSLLVVLSKMISHALQRNKKRQESLLCPCCGNLIVADVGLLVHLFNFKVNVFSSKSLDNSQDIVIKIISVSCISLARLLSFYSLMAMKLISFKLCFV